MIENLEQYAAFLVQSIQGEADKKKLKPNDTYSIQWAELELLLSRINLEISNKIEFTNEPSELQHCCSCRTLTLVNRMEQLIVKQDSDDILYKCLNCVIDTLKKDQMEFQQVRAYHWFLKEHNLEEDFKLFIKEVGNRVED